MNVQTNFIYPNQNLIIHIRFIIGSYQQYCQKVIDLASFYKGLV
ncbi:hypothetical protein pb186bvf_000345 [Paramecium bursaria]